MKEFKVKSPVAALLEEGWVSIFGSVVSRERMGELIFCRLWKESADESGEEGVLLNSESGTEILIYSKFNNE